MEERDTVVYRRIRSTRFIVLVCHGVARDIAWCRKGSKCRRAHGRKKGRNARRWGGNSGSRRGEIEAARRKPARDWW